MGRPRGHRLPGLYLVRKLDVVPLGESPRPWPKTNQSDLFGAHLQTSRAFREHPPRPSSELVYEAAAAKLWVSPMVNGCAEAALSNGGEMYWTCADIACRQHMHAQYRKQCTPGNT